MFGLTTGQGCVSAETLAFGGPQDVNVNPTASTGVAQPLVIVTNTPQSHVSGVSSILAHPSGGTTVMAPTVIWQTFGQPAWDEPVETSM
jgi:hypothetical protein